MCSTNVLALMPLLVKIVNLLVRLGMHSHTGGRMVSTLPRHTDLGPKSALYWLSVQKILASICAAVRPHRTQKILRITFPRHVALRVRKRVDGREAVHR